MVQNMRISKLMRFGIKVAENQAKEKGFHSPTFKESDYINYIVSDWLRQNYTQKELYDMGFDEIID